MQGMLRTTTALFAALACLLSGCADKDALDTIRARGELVVVSRNSPSTYYLDRNGPAGFEHELTSRLAQDLGVQLRVQPAFSLRGLFRRLRRGEADLAAAGLTLTAQRAANFPHSISYDSITTQVIYRAGQRRPRDIRDLPGMNIVALADSSHAAALQSLRDTTLPDLQWRDIREGDTMDLLDMVRRGKAELALIDSNEFKVQQTLYPRLKVAFDLSSEQDMVWYLPPGRDNARFLARINAFLDSLRRSGALEDIRHAHFGHTEGISRISSHTFTLKMHRELPPYRGLIKRVAAEYQMDWRLLAAIAYQESHWNPKAASPTGVRGMMMLTVATARELGVENRLDTTESLRGGARYFKNMLRRLPASIEEPDRTWMALAAYNIGLGHLEDARVITQNQGANPDLWRDVMERLPLLQKSRHYRNTRYGYARGREAVTYVQNIRQYYSILRWQDLSANQELPPLRTRDYLAPELRKIRLRAL